MSKPPLESFIKSPIQKEDLEQKGTAIKELQMLRGKKGDKGEKGDKGDPGKDGVSPKSGVDYEVPKRGRDGLDGVDGKDGINGKDGKNGKDGEKGKDGKDGKDGEKGERGSPGKTGINGRDGKDGTTDTPDEVVHKVNKAKLKILKKQIEGFDDVESYARSANDKIQKYLLMGGSTLMQFQSAGNPIGSASTIDFADGSAVNVNGTIIFTSGNNPWMPPETPQGLIDGSNVTYTLSYIPNTASGFLFLNGMYLIEGIDWTINTNILTMTTAIDGSLSSTPFIFKGQFFKAIPPVPPSTNSFLIQDGSTLTLQDSTDLLLNP